MKKVSIIIPIYNVEKYLSRCIESVLHQSYKNIEILLVNDGSTDNCEKICKNYLKKDSRIIYLKKKNGGLSDARNYGLKYATGEYLCFIDSDDYIHPRYVEVLLNSIIKKNTKIAVCLHRTVTKKEPVKYEKNIKTESIIFTKEAAFKKLLEYTSNNIISNHIHSKIFDSSLFKNIKFPVGKNFEDIGTFYLLLDKVSIISIIPEKLYFYYYRENSITKIMSLKSINDKYELTEIRNNYLIKKYENLAENIMIYNKHNYINLIKELIKKEGYNVNNNLLYQKIKGQLICLNINSKLSLKEKIIYISIKLNSKVVFYALQKFIGGD